jgi:hypothetical protein
LHTDRTRGVAEAFRVPNPSRVAPARKARSNARPRATGPASLSSAAGSPAPRFARKQPLNVLRRPFVRPRGPKRGRSVCSRLRWACSAVANDRATSSRRLRTASGQRPASRSSTAERCERAMAAVCLGRFRQWNKVSGLRWAGRFNCETPNNERSRTGRPSH